MHIQEDGLHPQASRKEITNRNRTTLTLSDQTRTLLRKIGNGSMSDGAYLSSQIVNELVRRKIIRIEYEKSGIEYRLHSGEKLVSSPRSGSDEAKRLHRGARGDKLFLNPKVNPYAGRVLSKEQLMNTGHFTHRMMRAILPGQRVTDRFGYWWIRVDNPDKPIHEQRGMRNSSGRLMATYAGLESEWDDWGKYSHQIGEFRD